ncbi:MAG: iron ABC transporter permease [Bacteroidota bacterium]
MQNTQKHSFWLIVLGFSLVGLFLWSITVGAVEITVIETLQIIAQKAGISEFEELSKTKILVLWNIRLPRLLLAIVVGAGLGLSGASLQGLFRNPLVEPGIIGVSSGAVLGAVLVIIFLSTWMPELVEKFGFWLTPLFAFVGGSLTTFITLRLSVYEGKTQITYLILAGVAINALAGAVIGLAIFYADDMQLRSYTFWTLGDLSVATWDKLYLLIPLVGIAIVPLITSGRLLNAMALGESEAYHSGVSVERVKIRIIFCSALAVGVSVALTGIIGFVGLVVPHIARIARSADHRWVLPASALGGALLLMAADLLARTVVAPAELPVGVVTAMVGAPFFLYLLILTKKKGMI